jgi:CRP-like cAMP-binding protein
MTDIKTINDSLKALKFFNDIEPDMVEYISHCGQNKHFHPGEYIGKEGEPAEHFYIIRSGKVALELHQHAKGTIMLKTLGAGDIMGISWIVPPYRLNFDMRALEETSVIEFDGTCIRGKCDEDPKLGYTLLKKFTEILGERLKNTRLQLLDVYN